MVKFFLALLIQFSVSGIAGAQNAGKLDLDIWIEKNFTTNPNYHFTIVVVESDFSDKGDPVLADVTSEQVEKISMFKLANSKSLAWDLKLNAPRVVNAGVREKLQKLTDATYFLFVPKKGKTVFAKRGNKGTIDELFSGKFGKEQDWPAIFAWIQKKYGWDGIILAAEGNQLIAAAPAVYFKDDIQALAIAGSEKADILDKTERTGAGLLSLVQSKNGFALFESVFVDESAKIQPGTKLIIEKRRK